MIKKKGKEMKMKMMSTICGEKKSRNTNCNEMLNVTLMLISKFTNRFGNFERKGIS